MRSEVVHDVVERNSEVLEHCVLAVRVVVEGNVSVEDAPVAGLLDVGSNGEYHPERVVREVAADISVALLCEGLVLVVASAVGELSRSDVDETLSCALGNLMYKAEDILIGVTEAHASADTALEV